MKKTLYFLIGFILILLGYTKVVNASQELANMDASVSVNPVFTMEISSVSLEFGSVNPGTTTKSKELTLLCSSNNNTKWSLQIFDTAELTSEAHTISNENFKWTILSAGKGKWDKATTAISTTPFTFYECGSDEYLTTAPIKINLSFSVDIPLNQPAGAYSTTLVLTMTE